MLLPCNLQIKTKIKRYSLQVQMPDNSAVESMIKNFERVRASFCVPLIKKCYNGSLTVEAALVLPAVLFVLIGFIYFMVIMNLQTELYKALIESGRNMARYAFAYEEVLHLPPSQEQSVKEGSEPGFSDFLYHGFSSAYALEMIKERVGRDWLDRSCIRGGSNGLSMLSDGLLANNDYVDLVLRYDVEIPYLPEKWFRLFCVQRVKIRTWTGFAGSGMELGQQEEQVVFITKTGEVYHKNKNCTYLNRSIKTVDVTALETIRNGSGAKYYPCEKCLKENTGGLRQVYLTTYGDRYHDTLECSAIKRDLITIPITETGDRHACKKCSQ